MQEDDKSQDWQQPAPANSGAPFQPVPTEPTETLAQPSVEAQPDATTAISSEEPASASDVRATEADEAVVQWQATEYMQHARSAKWFMVLAGVSVVLILIALFLMQSVSFAILVPVMAAALVIYVRRPPGIIDYTVSRKGIHINDALHPYDEFRSFGVMSHDNAHAIVLIPRKRFQLSQTMYFPEEVGEGLVDMLAARLPMNEVKPDAVDRFLARIRL